MVYMSLPPHDPVQNLRKKNPSLYRPIVPSWNSIEVTNNILETVQSPLPPLRETPVPKRVCKVNPADHTFDDIGKFYVIPEEDKAQLFPVGGLRTGFRFQMQAFAEMAIMIRNPAVEIIDYINRSNFSKPAVRYVLYGQVYSGKSVSIIHLLHYGKMNNYVLVNIPWAADWFRWKKKEACLSESKPGLVDIPLEGAVILKNFQLQNAHNSVLDLPTSNDYVWNEREVTPAGSSLSTLVNHGINRVKYSCDCVDALIKELKILCTNGKCKMLIFINGFNAFYSHKTVLKVQDHSLVTGERVSLVQTLLNAVKPDWSNGAIVLSVSTVATFPDNREFPYPLYLLKKKGFEDLDPFIPIEVPGLTDQEFNNLLDYYEDRRWIQKSGGRDEISSITMRLPGHIAKYCNRL